MRKINAAVYVQICRLDFRLKLSGRHIPGQHAIEGDAGQPLARRTECQEWPLQLTWRWLRGDDLALGNVKNSDLLAVAPGD